MTYEDILQALIPLLKKKFPDGYNYTSALADMLQIHPKTVKRRLKGKTEFSAYELIKISQEWDISLDSLYIEDKDEVKYPMETFLYTASAEDKYREMIQKLLMDLQLAAECEFSNYYVVTGNLPDLSDMNHDWVTKFHYFKQAYFNKGIKDLPILSNIILEEPEIKMEEEYKTCMKKMKRSIYILHIHMMRNITDYIHYFYELKCLTSDEVKFLIENYHKLLDTLEEICTKGYITGHENEVNIFYCELPFSNDFTIIDSTHVKTATIYTFFTNSIVNKGPESFHILHKWFYSLIRSSYLISISGHEKRMDFFNTQRNELDRLANL